LDVDEQTPICDTLDENTKDVLTIADALMDSMTDPVMRAPLPMVEVVEQEDVLGLG
jgi:hypothetical protein